MLVLVCAGGSPSLKWLFSIISRVSSGVSVRVPSGLYTESSFAFFVIAVFQNFAHPGRFLGRFGVGTEFAPFITLSLGVEFVVCFVADAKVIPEGWAVTSPCRHEFALHVSMCIFHFWSEPWWFFNST